jgi:hypothetical protein
MEVSPLYVLLAKLEEEISYQRKVVNTFLFVHQRLTQELFLRTIEILKRTAQTFRLISLILDEVDDLNDRYLREQALLLSSECLSLTSLLLPAVENASPLFFESVFISEEPILDRIESLAEYIESSIQASENFSAEEIAKTVEEIQRTLEYHIRVGERTLGKIL